VTAVAYGRWRPISRNEREPGDIFLWCFVDHLCLIDPIRATSAGSIEIAMRAGIIEPKTAEAKRIAASPASADK
jgi:hypothetical protein